MFELHNTPQIRHLSLLLRTQVLSLQKSFWRGHILKWKTSTKTGSKQQIKSSSACCQSIFRGAVGAFQLLEYQMNGKRLVLNKLWLSQRRRKNEFITEVTAIDVGAGCPFPSFCIFDICSRDTIGNIISHLNIGLKGF